MDIFNRKRVEELEEQVCKLEGVDAENNRLRRELDRLANDLREVLRVKDTTPADCTPGNYCKVCEFGKHLFNHYYASGSTINRPDYSSVVSGYICGRGITCQNFIQKTEENNE